MLIAKVKKVIDPRSGERMPFSKGEKIEVSYVDMGQSYTYVQLKDYVGVYNSVLFDFFEDGRPIDIYSSRKYNPYI